MFYKILLLALFSTSQLLADVKAEFIFEKAPFPSCHASTLTETSSGKLLCAFFGGSKEGASDVGIWLSTNNELSWSEPLLIAKEDEVPCWNPVLHTNPSGEILLFYKVGLNPYSWSGMLKRSFDDGITWTEAEPLPAGIIGPAKNKPLQLDDSSLLCGSSLESYKRWGSYIDITRDNGLTWEKTAPINLPGKYFGIIQPALIKMKEGKILLLARSRHGHICKSISLDNGKTWSIVEEIDLPNPNASVDAIKIDTGDIWLVYNHSTRKRFPLLIALSKDGEVWNSYLTLEENEGEFSYPCIIQTKDKKIHITYTHNRSKIKHVIIDQ